jgi:hypothetical protein
LKKIEGIGDLEVLEFEMEKELVIAVYNRDYSTWATNIDKNVKITPYRKGTASPLLNNEIKIEPHVGRDVHTFFWHIYHNYENLSEYTFFVQDFPFDHWGNLIEKVNSGNFDDCQSQIGGYFGYYNSNIGIPFTLENSEHFLSSKVLSCQSNGLPHDSQNNVNVDKFWNFLFKVPPPSKYEFIPGGHFVIHNLQVYKRTKEFYKNIVNLLELYPESPWCIERLELYIFDDRFETMI